MLDILSRDGRSYPETVKAAREAAGLLKQALEPRILGKELAATRCGCGALHSGKAQAVEILPSGGGEQYESQIASWALWSVRMKEIDGSGHGYSTGLSSFIPTEEIEALFSEYFKDIDADYLHDEKLGQEFRPRGKEINLAKDSEAHLEKGREILAHHVKYNSLVSGFAEVQAKIEEDELYLALVGAVHNSKPGDVLSVPTDEMRVFAHRYMAFAGLEIYLLVECGDTVSLGGVIQNVRRQVVETGLVTPE